MDGRQRIPRNNTSNLTLGARPAILLCPDSHAKCLNTGKPYKLTPSTRSESSGPTFILSTEGPKKSHRNKSKQSTYSAKSESKRPISISTAGPNNSTRTYSRQYNYCSATSASRGPISSHQQQRQGNQPATGQRCTPSVQYQGQTRQSSSHQQQRQGGGGAASRPPSTSNTSKSKNTGQKKNPQTCINGGGTLATFIYFPTCVVHLLPLSMTCYSLG